MTTKPAPKNLQKPRRRAFSPVQSKRRTTSDRFAKAYLAQLHADFKAGTRAALFTAVSFCHGERRVAPDWVVDEFAEAMIRFFLMEAEDLGEAFGIAHPKGTRVRGGRKNTRLSFEVFGQVTDAISTGRKVDNALFEEIAERLSIGKTLTQDLYYTATTQFAEHPAARTMRDLLKLLTV